MIDQDLLEVFRRAGAATVHEAYGRRGDVDPRIMAMTPGLSVAGTAFTVVCERGDNLAIHRAIAEARANDVLVVCGHHEKVGYLGDILAEAAQSRGIAGVVIDGSCRDIAELRRMKFPVWARDLAIRGATKTMPGSLAIPLWIGGVPVAAGDLVVADDDGVCIVSQADVDTVLEATRRRLAQEEDVREKLRAGGLTLDLLNLRNFCRA
ncbi:MAG: 4-carboxy-4-hydroxy-2-oxoadipate aldolase/oxaloacetate decarboxylase [Rhizobiaceae bacterium]|nr:4-carboxy-4-hydroxy-2-oxoadipate aldolase/oxaloacetate decarboxylase [Rhizobiaceae bacterium]